MQETTYSLNALTRSRAEPTRCGQPFGTWIWAGFACLDMAPPDRAPGHQDGLDEKTSRIVEDSAAFGGLLQGGHYDASRVTRESLDGHSYGQIVP